MLKRFTIENFSSFRDENTFDLTAGRTEVNQEHVAEFSKVKILKSAVLYGANASGKSNLFKSIDYAKKIILNNLDAVDTYKKYFRLDENNFTKATTFDFEIEINNKFFSYGFSSILHTKEIEEEWFYEISKKNPEKIFERNKNIISLGKALAKNNRFEIYVDDMKNQSKQLFLTEIADKDLDELKNPESKIINDLYNWFSEKLIIIYPNTQYEELNSISKNADLTKVFKKYLIEFDTGVVDISSIDEDYETTLNYLPSDLRKNIEKDLLEPGIQGTLETPDGQIMTLYKDDENNIKIEKLGLIHGQDFKDTFELKDESDGTKRLFDLIPLIGKFSQDYTIIIDEFDRSLHPKLTKKFFELFYKENKSKTQLLVSTHESTLLDLDLVRRDEVWFIEKDKKGASKVFSLNQFKVRYDSKIEKAYLLGRYGAIPIFKTFDEIDISN